MKTDEVRPYSESLVSASASARSSAIRNGDTGPKVSLVITSMLDAHPASTAGS